MLSTMQEVAGLEALEHQMARNLTALKEQKLEAEYSKTLTGRVVNWGGFFFAIYCVYRIAMVRFSTLSQPSQSN